MTRRKKALLPYNRLVGYARVSTREQNLDLQIDELKRAGVLDDNLWVEKVSGVSSKRPQRDLALIDAREGDTFVVWRLDRLGRSVVDLYNQVEALEKRGVKFRSLRDNIDTSTAIGKMLFGLFAVLAEFERNQTIERTLAGMAAARARGRMPGRASKIKDWTKVEKLLAAGWTRAEVAEKFKVSRQTIYVRYNTKDVERLRRKRHR